MIFTGGRTSCKSAVVSTEEIGRAYKETLKSMKLNKKAMNSRFLLWLIHDARMRILNNTMKIKLQACQRTEKRLLGMNHTQTLKQRFKKQN